MNLDWCSSDLNKNYRYMSSADRTPTVSISIDTEVAVLQVTYVE